MQRNPKTAREKTLLQYFRPRNYTMQASQKNGKTHFPKERSRTTLEFYWKNRTWNSTGIMWCQSKIALRAIASNKSNPSTMTINRFIMKASTRAQFGLPESIDRYINAWTSSSTFGTRAVGKTHFQHHGICWTHSSISRIDHCICS